MEIPRRCECEVQAIRASYRTEHDSGDADVRPVRETLSATTSARGNAAVRSLTRFLYIIPSVKMLYR